MKNDVNSIGLIKQPEGSKLCGQTCVAMVTGCSLDESIAAIGHKRGTCWSELRDAIIHFGCQADQKLTRVKSLAEMPELCIARVYWDRKQSHWIVRFGVHVFDPVFGKGRASKLSFVSSPGTRITSCGSVSVGGLHGDRDI